MRIDQIQRDFDRFRSQSLYLQWNRQTAAHRSKFLRWEGLVEKNHIASATSQQFWSSSFHLVLMAIVIFEKELKQPLKKNRFFPRFAILRELGTSAHTILFLNQAVDFPDRFGTYVSQTNLRIKERSRRIAVPFLPTWVGRGECGNGVSLFETQIIPDLLTPCSSALGIFLMWQDSSFFAPHPELQKPRIQIQWLILHKIEQLQCSRPGYASADR